MRRNYYYAAVPVAITKQRKKKDTRRMHEINLNACGYTLGTRISKEDIFCMIQSSFFEYFFGRIVYGLW